MADDNLKLGAQAPAGGLSAVPEYDGPETKTITLRKSLKQHDDDENPVTELQLTEPTARQLSTFLKAQNKAGADDVEAAIAFIAANVGMKPQLLMDMGARDMGEALDFLSGFIPDTQKTGAT